MLKTKLASQFVKYLDLSQNYYRCMLQMQIPLLYIVYTIIQQCKHTKFNFFFIKAEKEIVWINFGMYLFDPQITSCSKFSPKNLYTL